MREQEGATTALVYQFVLDHSDWPAERVRLALDLKMDDFDRSVGRLEQLRMLLRSPRGTLMAVSLGLATDALWREEAGLIDRQLCVQGLRRTVGALEQRYLATREGNDPHAANAYEHILDLRLVADDLAAQVEREVAICLTGAPIPEALDEQRSLKILHRDVTMRVLVQETARSNSLVRRYIGAIWELGAQVHTGVDLPPPMALIDAKLAIVAADHGKAVLLREPALVSYLRSVFEILWHDTRSLPRIADPPEENQPSEIEGSLIRWLAEGFKDETVARYLGISVRTCRRHSADLMKRLGASTRFEAGVKAAQRGWLELDIGADR